MHGSPLLEPNTSRVLQVPEDSAPVPNVILHIFDTLAAAGVLANCYLLLQIARRLPSFTRLNLVVSSLAVCDILLLTMVAPLEVRVLNQGCDNSGSWAWGPSLCRVFLGMEVLLNTQVAYLLVLLGATAHARSSVIVPLICTCALSTSLSVPAFFLAHLLSPRRNLRICSYPHEVFLSPIPPLLLIFRYGVPFLCLLITTILAIRKLCKQTSRHKVPEAQLRLLVTFSFLYGLLSLHRSVFTSIYSLKHFHGQWDGPSGFQTPPLANIANSAFATVAFSMVHYLASISRPFFVIFNFRDLQVTAKSTDSDGLSVEGFGSTSPCDSSETLL